MKKIIYHLKNTLFVLSKPFRKIYYYGNTYYCPVCKSHLRNFISTRGPVKRPGVRCPVCWSLERHRFVWEFLRQETNLFDGTRKRMLHVAPELVFMAQIAKITNLDYITADLRNPRAKVKMDITNIHFPDNSFDVIYCSHVLEHVPDDLRAIGEFHRVLKPDG